MKKEVTKKLNKLAVVVAKHYANVSCPLITFQTCLPKEVKNIRKKLEN